MLAIVNGNFVQHNEPVVPAESRGLMYGDGCFETLCSYRGHFFKLAEHLERLKGGLGFLGIDLPEKLLDDNLKSMLSDLLAKNELLSQKAIIRLQVWRKGGRGYKTESKDAHYSIICNPITQQLRHLTLATVSTKRIPSQSLPAKFKFTNGLNYIRASRQAMEQGADDALMETINGYLSETTIANIFWMKDDEIFTPSVDCDLLPGITRQTVLEFLQHNSEIIMNEGRYVLDDIKKAQAVWVCNSVKEIAAVKRIDDIDYSAGISYVEDLQNRFSNYISEHLTPLN